MNNQFDEMEDLIDLIYNILNKPKLESNKKLIKRIFTIELKKIYNELENLNIKNYIENETNNQDYKLDKYHITRLSTIAESLTVPFYGDFLTHIYNNSEFNIRFELYINSIKINEYNLESKEYVYPLNNNTIIPLYLLNNCIKIIFFNKISIGERRKLIFINRYLSNDNSKFLKSYAKNINYYTINENICNVIQKGIYVQGNSLSITNFLTDEDACFDKSIIDFSIEI
jgi:hypothetical protein